VNAFQETLQRLLDQSGKTVTQLSALSGVDRAYVKRLLSGEKTNPSTETIVRLWIGLAMDPKVVEAHPDFTEELNALLLALAMSNVTLR
jgi:transcriptional regulator with XRE-family HTH domain